MTDEKLNEYIELIYLGEKLLSTNISDIEREKQQFIIQSVVNTILDEGGPELFFKVEEKLMEKFAKDKKI